MHETNHNTSEEPTTNVRYLSRPIPVRIHGHGFDPKTPMRASQITVEKADTGEQISCCSLTLHIDAETRMAVADMKVPIQGVDVVADGRITAVCPACQKSVHELPPSSEIKNVARIAANANAASPETIEWMLVLAAFAEAGERVRAGAEDELWPAVVTNNGDGRV